MTERRHERDQVLAQLAPIAGLLSERDLFEVAINEPGAVWVENSKGWSSHEAPEMTFGRLINLSHAVASWSSQKIGVERPVLSATLPDDARIQIVVPPAVRQGTVSLTIRKPSSATFTLAGLNEAGLFDRTRVGRATQSETDTELSRVLRAGDTAGFLRRAVHARKNIIVSGATGSGKTTLSKALIAEIPQYERIITIEDTPELKVLQRNHVRLFYSKGGQGLAKVGPKELLESSLRMRPDRILLAELRDGTAFDYLRNVNSGHPGSITTVHADSCSLAFEQLTLLVKESDGGGNLARDDIRGLLVQLVDVVVQCERAGGVFGVSEIDFVPERRAL